MKQLAAVFFCLAALGGAQDKRPEFEVASIKPAAPNAQGMYINTAPGGRITVTNMTLKEMIVIAWRILPFQISGGAGWIGSERWDIAAKPEAPPAQAQLPLMIRALLEDRFQLVLHQEAKELPVYALIMAKKDGKPGPRLTETVEGNCIPPDPTKPPSPPDPAKLEKTCGNMRMGRGSLSAAGIPVTNLLPMLGRILGRPVIDRTGLTGKFDVSMEWTPDETLAMQFPAGAPKEAASAGSGPSLFAALQEQLGLKLESQKGSVDIFIIDRAAKPSEN